MPWKVALLANVDYFENCCKIKRLQLTLSRQSHIKKFYNIDLLLNKCPTLMLQQSKVLYNWQMLDVQLSTNYLEMTMTTVARSNQDATAEARWQG